MVGAGGGVHHTITVVVVFVVVGNPVAVGVVGH